MELGLRANRKYADLRGGLMPRGTSSATPPTTQSAFSTPPGWRLKSAKRALLRAAFASGLARKVRDSAWRSARVLILAYHGVSLLDEHEWNPELYLPAHALRGRFRILKEGGYNVLPLKEAIERLSAGTLPPRAVALTFDDGAHDFSRVALPLLREFQFPATVYVTSYYSGKEVPVFRIACQYLLWKGRERVISGEGLTVTSNAGLDLRNPEDRSSVAVAIEENVRARGPGIDHEMAALRVLAERVGVDFNEFLGSRLLQIMSAEEIRNLPDELVDVQLHTHRHRVPLDRAMFEREVKENREYLEPLRGNRVMDGFCYPSGLTNPRFLPWLHDLGIRTATTCRVRLASAKSDLLMLPRLVDSWRLSQLEFEGWLTGIAQALPQIRRGDYSTQVD